MEKYLDAHQIIEATGLSRTTVYAMLHAEGFPATRVGKRIIVSESALTEWLARGGTAPRDDGSKAAG